jgi:hypothetical protein
MLHARGIKHALDAPANAGGSLGLGLPDGLQHPEHIGRGDLAYRPSREACGVIAKRVTPLLPVLCVAPARPFRGDEILCIGPEYRDAPRGRSRLVALLPRVDPFGKMRPAFGRPFARPGK